MSKDKAKNLSMKLIDKWSDEQCLFNFAKFLDRVGISTQFIQTEDGMLTHQVLTMACGDKVIVSEPRELSWPLQPMPVPESLKDKVN